MATFYLLENVHFSAEEAEQTVSGLLSYLRGFASAGCRNCDAQLLLGKATQLCYFFLLRLFILSFLRLTFVLVLC